MSASASQGRGSSDERRAARPVEGPVTVYLVRHGRTELNASGQLRGQLDPPLDEVGRQEAEALGAVLAPLEPSVVVTSPLRRAAGTAEAIAGECGLVAEVDPALVDRDYGPWAGSRLEDVLAQWGALSNAPGVEPLDDLLERARLALDDVLARVRSGRAVVVAHDAVNRTLLMALAPGRWQHPEEVPQRTGCLNVLYHDRGGWLVAKADVKPVSVAREPTRR